MCDTFVVMPPHTADRSIIFGKNSDREPNEAQALEYHPGGRHPAGSRVMCTYIDIPQARETQPVLIGRPFWMWGAEMGINAAGVTIGNEAVWTRMPVDRSPSGLTGMDLLRLALERSTSAEQALECIVGLLADHGQAGICGYTDRRMAYHNSFLIADPGSAWVLETAGPLWAARRIRDYYAVSNRLTIGRTVDRAHPDLVANAQRRGWLKSGTEFHFAKCYSDWFFTTFSASAVRRQRANECMGTRAGNMEIADAFSLLRDHGPENRSPAKGFLGSSICAHAANPLARDATQTTGSLVTHAAAGGVTAWATGTSAPCTSLYKPIRFGEKVLPDIGPTPDAYYRENCLWWRHERFHREILQDYRKRLGIFAEERDQLEAEWLSEAGAAESVDWFVLTSRAFRQADENTAAWCDRIADLPQAARPGWWYRRYWTSRSRRAQMPARR